MALELPRYRADVDQALSQAISSRDVTEQQTSIQQQSSRLKAAAYAQAGEAIGKGIETGLTKAFDPTDRINKQNMIRQSQAQAQDFANRDFADKVRATGVEVQGQGIYDKLGIKDTPEQSFQNVGLKKYGPEIMKDLPQDVKDQGAALFKEIRGPAGATRFHKYEKGVELKAGKYGSKEYMGRAWDEAPDIKNELEESAWDKIESLPSMRTFLLERGQAVQMKNSLGKQGLSGSISVWNATKDRELTGKATQIEDMYNDQTKYPFQVGDSVIMESIREAAANNHIDQRWVRENINNIVKRAPRSAVDKTGKWHPTFNPELLAQAVNNKDKLDASVYRNFLNWESGKANEGMVRWDSSKTVFNRIMSMDWLKSLPADQQKQAQERINNIANLTKAQPRLGQAAIASKNGVPVSADDLADALGTADAPTAVGKIGAELDALKALSPVVKDLMMPAASGSKNKSQWDIINEKAIQESMVDGNFQGAAGPLNKLLTKDVSDAEAAHIWNLMRDGQVNSPQFDNLTSVYTASGMSEADARSMAIAQGGEYERRLTVALSTPDPNGNNKDWTEAEKEQIADAIAKLVTAPSLKAFETNKGATGRTTLNMAAGRTPDTLSFNDAQDYITKAFAAKPELKDKGLVELDLGQDRTIIAINGKAMGYKKGDKATTFALLKGEFPTHLTESLNAAQKMAKDLLGIDMPDFNWNSISPLKTTHDKGVDDMMRAPVGPDGQSTYLWLKNHFKGDMRLAKDNDTAQALYLNLMNAAKKAGQDPWQMKDRLAAAAANTEDPVLEATAIFIGEALSPHKVTIKDLQNVEGGYPSGLIASIGKGVAQDEINKSANGSEPKDLAEGYNQNTQTAAKNVEAQKAEEEISGTAYAVAMGTAVAGGFVGGGGLPGALALPALTALPMLAHDYGVMERRFDRGEYFEEGPPPQRTPEEQKAHNAHWEKVNHDSNLASTARRVMLGHTTPEAEGYTKEELAPYIASQAAESRAAASRPSAPQPAARVTSRQEDPFVETIRKAARRAEQIRSGEKPDAEAPSRGKFLGARAESRPASRPESRPESRAESRAESRITKDQMEAARRELTGEAESAEREQARQREIQEQDAEKERVLKFYKDQSDLAKKSNEEQDAYRQYKEQAAQKHRQYGIQGAGTMTFEEWKHWAKSMEELKSMGGKK